MIESLSINNVASYDPDGVQFNTLKKVNFIYGSNGSGKTTISNFLDEEEREGYSECSVKWVGDQALKTLTYNKSFREKNFGGSDIDGVFTLGQATKEQVEEIEEKTARLGVLKDEVFQRKTSLENLQNQVLTAEEEFKESVWVFAYKKHEDYFKDAYKGFMLREKFKVKLLAESVKNEAELKSIDDLKERAKTLFGEAPLELNSLVKISFDRIVEIESDELWKAKIIGKSDVDISVMIQRLNMNDWVNQGRAYIQDETCPFCQEATVTEGFKAKLEGYFDETFSKSIEGVKALSAEYRLLSDNLCNQLQAFETTEKEKKLSKVDIDKLSAYIKTFVSQFVTNNELISNKLKEPSRSIDLVDVNPQMDEISQLIDDAQKEVDKHNKIVANFRGEHSSLVNEIWKFLIVSYVDEIASYKKKINGLNAGLEQLTIQYKAKRQEWRSLDNEIKELSENVTSIEPTVNKINATLQQFGFENFEIKPSDELPNHYQIQREDGELVGKSLSEGEVTFITFLYFVQLAKGAKNRTDVSEERILVVDDPISSLDSTVLFVVSTILKGIIFDIKKDVGNIKQLLVLTHNVYFHKEVSFVNGQEQKNGNTNFWILRKKDKVSDIQSFEMDNPIKTSYELLWGEIRNREHNSKISIQNTMRRIIENYFRILGKYGDDELIGNFTEREDQNICRSLLCWVNDGSHSVADDLFIELQDDSIEKYLEVFKKVFFLTDHKGHYNMMMGEG